MSHPTGHAHAYTYPTATYIGPTKIRHADEAGRHGQKQRERFDCTRTPYHDHNRSERNYRRYHASFTYFEYSFYYAFEATPETGFFKRYQFMRERGSIGGLTTEHISRMTRTIDAAGSLMDRRVHMRAYNAWQIALDVQYLTPYSNEFLDYRKTQKQAMMSMLNPYTATLGSTELRSQRSQTLKEILCLMLCLSKQAC